MDQILRKFQNLPTTVRMSVPKGSTAVSYFLKLREIMISSRELFEQLTDKTVATQKVDPITFVTGITSYVLQFFIISEFLFI